ncbi:hypothetical protein D9M71_513520 [compost metagenome]
MAYGFVQQHPGPTRAQHHWQGTRRRRNCFQVDQRLAQGLAGITHGTVVAEEVTVIGTASATMTSALAAAVLLDDHTDVKTYQGAHVGGQAAIGRGDQDPLPDARHAHGNLLNARIQRASRRIDTLEQFDLFRAADDFKRIVLAIQARHVFMAEDLHFAILTGTGNRACCTGSLLQGIQSDGIAVGKPRFLP